MQGDFNSWVDGTLLTHTFWFEPDIHRKKEINRTIQILSTDTNNTPEAGPESWRHKQPDQSLHKNCTVAVIDSDPKFHMKWYVIPCNETFLATYICQAHEHPHTAQSVSSPSPHLDCEENWFGLANHSKCYMMIRSPLTLTFDAAVQSCSLMNSSLLKLISYGQASTRGDVQRLIELTRKSAMFPTKNEGSGWTSFGFDFKSLFYLQTWKTLNNAHPLLIFIKLCSEHLLNNIRILASVDGRCARVEYPLFTFVEGSRRWIADFCSDYTNPTDVFICEKSRLRHTTIMCNADYYQCQDATCILSLYVCDSVNDCSGGEDETQCEPLVWKQAWFSFQKSHLYLPCSLYHNCNDTLGSMVPPVKLHTICDGLMSHVIKLDEDDKCIKRRVKHINLRQLITNSRWTNKWGAKYSDDLYELQGLQRLKQNETNAMKKQANQLLNQNVKDTKEFEIPCIKSNYYTTFSDICKIRASGIECALPGRNIICSYMICPGMFRCRSLYCIHMSLVCDGQINCIYGEDEAACTNPSCPGFLKCRGESRCISPDQICDGIVDCSLSFDDEITCGYCPTFCKCDGYLLYCAVENKTDVITITGGSYSKGVVLKGEQTILSIDIFSTLSLIFIDISNCKITQIIFTLHTHTFQQHILFGNFSVNSIKDCTFFRADLLSKLVVVDISNNLISVLSSDNLQLTYLLVIYAKHNPIIHIQIGRGMDSLEFINLQHVEFQWRMTFKTSYLKMKTVVTDSILCCLWPKVIDCIYDGGRTKCYGIMTNMASHIAFIALTILTATTVLSVSIKTLKMLIMNYKVRKYHNICILNHIVASTFTTACLVCLSIVGMLDIHLISWRKSTGCHIINGFFSISVGAIFAFKAFSVVIIAMKIIFPFAHQCQWLKKTFLLCIFIWLTFFILYFVTIVVASLRYNNLFFDNFCSVGECHIPKNRRLMYAFTCSADCVFLLTIFIILLKTTLILREKNQTAIISREIIVSRVIFRLTKKIVPQTTFTICLYMISLVQLMDTFWKEQYCYAVFSYVLPSIIVIDCILSIY